MTEVRPATCPRCGSIGHGERKCPFPKDFSLSKVSAWERVRTEPCQTGCAEPQVFKEVGGGSRNKVRSMWCRGCGARWPWSQQ